MLATPTALILIMLLASIISSLSLMPPEIINGFLIFNNFILCNKSKSNPFSVPSLSTEG